MNNTTIILQTSSYQDHIDTHLPFAFDIQHPDLLLINQDREGITIDSVRELQQWSVQRPYQADMKVAILLNAEDMNQVAQHAMLKMIEEPLPFVQYIFVTEYPHSLLATVRSRCRIISHIETNIEESEPTLVKLCNMNVGEKIAWSAQWKSKELAQTQMMSLAQEGLALLEKSPTLAMIHNLQHILSCLEKLDANVQVQLAVEDCVFQMRI